MASALPYTEARVERVVWAYRGPKGRRWLSATLWLQPHSPARVIVWTDRGRDRLRWFDEDVAAVEELDRMERALVAAGWAPVTQINTGHGYVMVELL